MNMLYFSCRFLADFAGYASPIAFMFLSFPSLLPYQGQSFPFPGIEYLGEGGEEGSGCQD